MPVRIGVICYTALDNTLLLASSSSSVKGTSSPHLEDLFCILANFLDAEMLVVWKKKKKCVFIVNKPKDVDKTISRTPWKGDLKVFWHRR